MAIIAGDLFRHNTTGGEGEPAHFFAHSLKNALRELEEALLIEVRRHYGNRLVSLVVYGSVGRGTMRPDSDIDLLIVADDLPVGRIARVNDFAEVERGLEPLLERLRQEGISTEFSPLFKNDITPPYQGP